VRDAVALPEFYRPVPPPDLPYIRWYDRRFDWAYVAPAVPIPPTSPMLVPVEWDGLSLNTGDDPVTGLCLVIENVQGWLDSPPLEGHDTARAIADGSAWGPKTLGARTVILTGSAAGPRDQLGAIRDQLAARAAARLPAPLAITDGGLDRTLVASVRGGTEAFRHTPLGSSGFRYQVSLTAADPAIYAAEWQQVKLSPGGGDATGRAYQRAYTWQYASSSVPNSAQLANDGNFPAVVYALYRGDLDTSELRDEAGGLINFAALDQGMEVLVESDTLSAIGAGGITRASYVLPGSIPMSLPPASSSRWHLYSAGYGEVTLAWRSAWV
jgi:hypothetical protein